MYGVYASCAIKLPSHYWQRYTCTHINDLFFMSSTFPGYNLFVSLFSGIHSSCNPAFPFELPTQSGT